MPAYKDPKTNTWYCKFNFKDYEGNIKQKLKRGFKLQREAKEWENNFLANQQLQPSITFKGFFKVYKADIYPQLRKHSIQSKEYKIKRIMPYFEDKPINDISTKDIRSWQNEMLKLDFSARYISNLQSELSSILNHAKKYYGLKENPCSLVGKVKKPDELPSKMRFWTFEQFSQVIKHISNKKAYTAILLLYWTGMRKGELYALTLDRLNIKNKTLVIDRSLQRLNGENVVTATKTYEVRKLLLPNVVINTLDEYIGSLYDKSGNRFIFEWEKQFIEKGIKEGIKGANKEIEAYNNTHNEKRPYIEPIHVHGLRHSHASYLINEGVNITLISKRLGHKNVSMTLDTYSHFYPTNEIDFIEKVNKKVY